MGHLGLPSILLLAIALAASGCVSEARGKTAGSQNDNDQKTAAQSVVPAPIPEPPPTKKVSEMLASGVVIVISLSSQQMHVFRDGVFWRSSPISTGKPRKETPQGVFAILQKKRFHRSNLFSNAPMPFMQRLTWDGIAIHAGRLPGYPASHGCIRLPRAFASDLYAITGPTTTAVIIVQAPLASQAEALALAKATDAVVPIDPALLRRESTAARAAITPPERMPAARSIAAPSPPVAVPAPQPARTPAPGDQTIQLAAALSPRLAAAQWEELSSRNPELRAMQMAVIPAIVNGKQYYRLRASAPDAHAKCKALKAAGVACFPVG